MLTDKGLAAVLWIGCQKVWIMSRWQNSHLYIYSHKDRNRLSSARLHSPEQQQCHIVIRM